MYPCTRGRAREGRRSDTPVYNTTAAICASFPPVASLCSEEKTAMCRHLRLEPRPCCASQSRATCRRHVRLDKSGSRVAPRTCTQRAWHGIRCLLLLHAFPFGLLFFLVKSALLAGAHFHIRVTLYAVDACAMTHTHTIPSGDTHLPLLERKGPTSVCPSAANPHPTLSLQWCMWVASVVYED